MISFSRRDGLIPSRLFECHELADALEAAAPRRVDRELIMPTAAKWKPRNSNIARFVLLSLRGISRACLLGSGPLILYLSFVPNPRGAMYEFLPSQLARFAGYHDNLANFAASAVLSGSAFWALRGRAGAFPERKFTARIWTAGRPIRLFGLLLFPCIVETAQLFIPGRFSSVQDVLNWWAGTGSAWLISAVLESWIIVAAGRR